MKIAINVRYGGFDVPDEFVKEFMDKYGLDEYDARHGLDNRVRTNFRLIEYIEKHGGEVSPCTRLEVVDIPDEATDFRIEEYDGAETVICVIDGKLVDL